MTIRILCSLQLNELSDRNAECVEMLHESQEEIKELRNRNTPSSGMRRHFSYGLYPMVRNKFDLILTDKMGTFQEFSSGNHLFNCWDRTPWQQRLKEP